MNINDKTYYPIVFNENGSFSIINNGTAAAPCRLTIIPENDIMQMTITGVSEEPIIINRVMRNQILVVDGIDRKVTIDGNPAFNLFEGWEFPKLRPGKNDIEITNASTASVSIEYQPRYI